MSNEESIEPSDDATVEPMEEVTTTDPASTDDDEGADDLAESEAAVTSPASGVTTSSTVERKTPTSLKLELDQKQAAFDDNHLVVTLTFAPNKVNPGDKQIMLALQIAGDVVALKSFKQSTFGPLPEPIETLLTQGRNEWPKRYADAVKARQAAQAKSASLTASAKTKAAKTPVKPKDIKAPPPPTPLFGSTPVEVKKPDAHVASPQTLSQNVNTATLFDLTD